MCHAFALLDGASLIFNISKLYSSDSISGPSTILKPISLIDLTKKSLTCVIGCKPPSS